MSVVVFQRVGYYIIHATHKKPMWIVRGLHKWGIPCHSLKSVLNPGAGRNRTITFHITNRNPTAQMTYRAGYTSHQGPRNAKLLPNLLFQIYVNTGFGG